METEASGGRYWGWWTADKKQGRGSYELGDGDYYVGEWADNNRDGKGIEVYFKSGVYYQGELKKGEKCGCGTQ